MRFANQVVLALFPAAAVAATPSVPLGGDYWKVPTGGNPALWGIADLHAHFFTDLAYGGRVFHGHASAPGGIAEALHDCGENHRGITPEGRHRHGGYPDFDGWPTWHSLVHQQAYVDWIRRAWQGGLRVVHMDVQNTPFLGKAFEKLNHLFLRGDLTPLENDNTSAVRIQAVAARALFETGPASDFAAIARTAEDARAIVASGKLAVVLGVEVEALGDLLRPEELGADPRASVRRLLEDLHAQGVRHVIPIHLTTNAFGHPAVFERVLGSVNLAETGRYYALEDGYDRGVRFDLREVPKEPVSFFFELLGALTGRFHMPKFRAYAAAEGLTSAGDILIEEMMRLGFIIDIDHMSEQAADRTLDLVEREGVPVIASHTSFRDLSFGTRVSFPSARAGDYRAEIVPERFRDAPEKYGTSNPTKVRTDRSRTLAQLRRIQALRGMVGIQLRSDGVGVEWRGAVANDCDGTTKSFAQMLAYASEILEGEGIAIGTDVGGFAHLSAPRFGAAACPGSVGDKIRSAGGRVRAQALAQRNGVRYSTSVSTVAERWTAMEEGPNAPLTRATAGRRKWDINLDGMAHYGMLPDFLQDLANVLPDRGALVPVLRSAEHFVGMWSAIERRAAEIRAR